MRTNTTANPLETGTDELERYAIEECIKRQRIDHRVSVLVMPAGRCELTAKFARSGARVTVADNPSCKQEVEGRILANGLHNEIIFRPYVLPELPETPTDEPFDIIVIRRGLCAMTYEQSRQIVRQLLLRLKIGGKLYISILGLHTELGEGYSDHDKPVEVRFSKLSPTMISKYGIEGPVCLYTERNLFMLLLEAGASVLRTLTTTYGNVKGVAVRV